MSFAQIEAELEHLSPDELRRLALKSWTTFVKKEGQPNPLDQCDDDDPDLLASLDEAIAKADLLPGAGSSAAQVRARLAQWTSR